MPDTTFHRAILLASTAIGLGATTPTWAQSANNDIIVTARRVEERLQDVPISITVINQTELQNNNISNAKDLATITPGLQINSRYGSDNTNFSIRGFTQEQRTSATVGTYFADVVAPRGSGGTFGGDGGGPGNLFDLQNIQVLKGPQGTLQGRNVTGGAVLLVPKKPTGRFEGYVEASAGDYDLRRIQAVVNVPVMDTLRVRLGVDRQTRDGFIRNVGTLGDGLTGNKGMGNVDYVAARVSIVADLTPNLENYTIASYTHSKSNGIIPKIASCNNSVAGQNFGLLTLARCQAQMAREAGYGPWTVENRLPDSLSKFEQWQIINTTTWRASDSLTIKNIASYAEFRQTTNLDLFGNYYLQAGQNPATVTSGAQVTGFAFTHANPIPGKTNAQSSFVEELQFQGHPGDGRFVWQAGAYVEMNDPLGFSGVQTATGTACNNIDTLDCVTQPGFSLGSINYQLSSTKFRDYAVYGQASYNITSKLKLTGGIRYTWDKEIAAISIQSLSRTAPGLWTCTNGTAPGFGTNFLASDRYGRCLQTLRQNSEAPTWLVGLDYKPMDDILLYAKYSRGYRAGGLSLFGPDSVPGSTANLQPYKPEKVDSYEVGAKTSWHGVVPGTFNVAAFYNKFSDQQLLLGAVLNNTPNALVANAGKSRLWGVEADLMVRPFKGFTFNLSYSHLDTKLQQFIPIDLGPGVALTPPLVGDPIPNTQPNKLNISGNYVLPFVPESIGRISFGGSYLYTQSYKAVAASCPAAQSAVNPNINAGCYDNSNNGPLLPGGGINPGAGINNVNPESGRIPASNIINLNVNWDNVGGRPLDLSFFMTNVTNQVYYVSLNDNTSRGFVSRLLGEPRMWGVRLKYRFGD
ncbi:MAG TPA: TonB-dependent receptor [Sphingobium sp.]|uniref:TonB-dependent receptor n=1 Tax=Sphingobium sp. TaxID=1912891 RepID=UPI002ED38A0E